MAHRREPAEPDGSGFPPGRWLSRLIAIVAYAGIAMLIVSIVLTCADILWRRIVGGAFLDTVDLTKLCLVAAASLSIPYGFTQGTHVTVDLLTTRFPAVVQQGIEFTISLISAALLGFLMWLAWQGAALHYRYGDTSLNLQIPMIYYWGIFLFGLLLAVLATLARAAEVAVALAHGGARR